MNKFEKFKRRTFQKGKEKIKNEGKDAPSGNRLG
jgi:hypothetical protein